MRVAAFADLPHSVFIPHFKFFKLRNWYDRRLRIKKHLGTHFSLSFSYEDPSRQVLNKPKSSSEIRSASGAHRHISDEPAHIRLNLVFGPTMHSQLLACQKECRTAGAAGALVCSITVR